jgi:hypothetical protein
MSGILSANPSVRRREEHLLMLMRARLDAIDATLDKMVVVAQAAPAFTDAEVEEVGRLLVEGKLRLPTHARLTATTTIEEVRSKIFGTSEVFTHTADQLHTKLLRPLTILQALEAGVIRRTPNGWAWSEAAYERAATNGRAHSHHPTPVPLGPELVSAPLKAHSIKSPQGARMSYDD